MMQAAVPVVTVMTLVVAVPAMAETAGMAGMSLMNLVAIREKIALRCEAHACSVVVSVGGERQERVQLWREHARELDMLTKLYSKGALGHGSVAW